MTSPLPTSQILSRISALSDATRLRILRLLEREELSVGEVAAVLQMPQSTVSRQLKVLGEGGWLAKRPAGPATYYSLTLDDLESDARRLWLAVREDLSGGPDFDEDDRRLLGVLRDRMTDSESFFGRVAGSWDALRTELFGDSFTPAALLSLIPSNWTVADLGCGTGNLSEMLSPVAERVMAVDSSPAMLDAARARLGRLANVEFLKGDLTRLPLPDGSVDACVCSLVLHHLDEPRAALEEMRRVLRRDRAGGVALVVDMYRHDRHEYRRSMGHKHLGFGEDEIRGLMEEAGLGEVRVTPLPSEAGARGPGLFAARGQLRAE